MSISIIHCPKSSTSVFTVICKGLSSIFPDLDVTLNFKLKSDLTAILGKFFNREIRHPLLTLTSKIVDGTFPDYKRVIPLENDKKLQVNANEFSEAVDRVSTVSSERSRAVKLSLSSGRLHLSVNSPENAKAEDEIPVDYNYDDLEIGFNARYLQELTSQVDGKNVEFSFKSSGDPALMKDIEDEGAIYVVMPMRV